MLDPLSMEPLDEPVPLEPEPTPLPDPEPTPEPDPLVVPEPMLPLPEPVPELLPGAPPGSCDRQRSRAEPVMALHCSRVMAPLPVDAPLPLVDAPLPLLRDGLALPLVLLLPVLLPVPETLLPELPLPEPPGVPLAHANVATLHPRAAAMTADFSMNIVLSFACDVVDAGEWIGDPARRTRDKTKS